ncbi:MAG TPA: TetR/AcrR family transcriptional regulator [Vicinamibacterales bacterium]|nr:TetR/AcrR family transcriptional regulator [Vicinamibacterales bacterium]
MRTSTDSSRERLLAAAKELFARMGFENTSTAAVAREAGTSESQLVRYFGTKVGLLEAIFEEAWKPLNAKVHDLLADASSGRAAVVGVLSSVLGAFDRDDQLATIFLFEGRRIRGEELGVKMSSGFLEFTDIIHRLIKRGQKDGSFEPSFDPSALAAALMGAAEAMVRERVLAKRAGAPKVYSDRQVQKIFEAMLNGFSPQ